MKKFQSRSEAEDTIKSCLYEIKKILNRDLGFTSLRNRSLINWFANFGKSIEHLGTKRILQKLELTMVEAEAFIISTLSRERNKKQNNHLEETWIG